MNEDFVNSAAVSDFDDAPSFSAQRTDSEIVALFFDRDEAAISAASSKYGKYISAVAMNVLGNFQDAEECVNDAMLKAWESIPPAAPKNLAGYLVKITKNICLNRYRQAHTEKRGGGEMTKIYLELGESVPGSDDIERSYENKELLAAVNAFLGKLPTNKRDIFVLRYWYCMNVTDLAARVGMTENRLAVELFRIRQKLVKHLRKRGF